MKEKSVKIIINEKEYILRPAGADDYQFAFNLLKENIRIIEYNNKKEGYVDFKFKPDCGYINNIQLSKNIQGNGLGTHIMLLLESETSNQGLEKIRLKVFKDNRAVNFYQRLKYKIVSEDETSIIMEKTLD